jgi:cytochrome c peroxidase
MLNVHFNFILPVITFNIAQFWDGRAKDLKEQAGGPIGNPKEMASNHDLAVKIISSIKLRNHLF